MKTPDLVIYAPNVHQGGGRTLLTPILQTLAGRDNIAYILDERMDTSMLGGNTMVKKVKPTVWGRLKNEFEIRRLVKKARYVLCMGNLPPLIANNENLVVFVQNRYLVDESIRNRLPRKVRLRLWMERLWLRARSDSVSRFVVQTDSMAEFLATTCDTRPEIIPFIPESVPPEDTEDERLNKYDFLYVASGEEHKNHENLLKAWVGLAQMGERPSLCLTVSKQRFPALYTMIEAVKSKYQLDITNVGELEHDEIPDLYRLSRALIYPSLFESFGLPLLDAVAHGIPVLAADRDYVYDLLTDPRTFDAHSPEAIARAVANFDFSKTTLAIKPCTALEFLQRTVLFEG